MMSIRSLLLGLVLCSFIIFVVHGDDTETAANDDKSDVVVLNDDNFEHDTQASTGATTGNWFVEFYAPWCGHCKNLAPEWELLASELKSEISVAKVDCTVNQATARRFNITGFPTIKYFVKGKLYEYKGARTASVLKEWAREGFRKETAHEVPKTMTFWELLVDDIYSTFNDVQSIYRRKPEACIMIGGIGLFFGVSLAAIIFIIVDRYRAVPVSLPPSMSPSSPSNAPTSSSSPPPSPSSSESKIKNRKPKTK